MVEFISPRTRESIDGRTILVAPGQTKILLTGDGVEGLTVVPEDSLLNDIVGGPTVVAGGAGPGYQEWIVTGRDHQSIRLRAVSAGVLPSDSLTFASCAIKFHAASAVGGPVTVHCITTSIFGSAPGNGLLPTTLSAGQIVVASSLVRGDPSNVLRFAPHASLSARVGVFAAKQDGVERAALLLAPRSGSPDRVLVGITHVFGQSDANLAFYDGLGWSNPLSPALIKFVANKFLGDYWGRQMMASSKSMAMLLPVRAKGHGELGPFANAAFLKKVLHAIATQSEAFTPHKVEMLGYSSGVYALNRLLPSMGGSLTAVYNIDPAGGTAAAAPHSAKAWQVLSGFTTHQKGKTGFELLGESRWANEPQFSKRNNKSEFPDGVSNGYLHNYVMPRYCLHLGIETL